MSLYILNEKEKGMSASRESVGVGRVVVVFVLWSEECEVSKMGWWWWWW